MKIKNKSAGFSLIEVAIGLMIVGLITAPMMIEYGAWKNSQIFTLTKGNGFTIKAALMKYALNNGCYPTPAPPGVASTNAAAGVETVARTGCVDLTVAQLAAIPPCVGNDTVVCQTPCTVGLPSTTCAAGLPLVLIGDVPFASLGLPKQYIVDGFNRKFTYAVPVNLVQASTFNDGGGAIRVEDLTNTGPPMATGPVITLAHFAIVSHGRDGVGAFSLEGLLTGNCAGPSLDVTNCNNDGSFNNGFGLYTDHKGIPQYDRQESAVAGASHFDDFVYYETTTSTDIWTKSTNSDIVSHAEPGNVLVKTPTSPNGPSNPQAKLDIRGDLSADALWASAVCDTSANSYASPTYTNVRCTTAGTPTAFSPDIIGGTPVKAPGSVGVHCGSGATAVTATTPNGLPAGTGIPMTGIAAANEQCTTVTSINAQAGYNIGSCPANKYPYGITGAGNLKCAFGPFPP